MWGGRREEEVRGHVGLGREEEVRGHVGQGEERRR